MEELNKNKKKEKKKRPSPILPPTQPHPLIRPSANPPSVCQATAKHSPNLLVIIIIIMVVIPATSSMAGAGGAGPK